MLFNEVFTESRGRLELVAHELAPADGVDVWGLVVDPLVKLILPAVKVDKQQAAHEALHGGHTHEARLHQVHRLQLHVGGEAVTWVVLKKDKMPAHMLIRKVTGVYIYRWVQKTNVLTCDQGKQAVSMITFKCC